MMAATFSALLLAAVTAFALIAYRHPRAYAKLYVVLVILVGAGWLAQMAFTVGYALGSRDTQLEIVKLNAPNTVKRPEPDSSFDFRLFIASALFAYLTILRGLPLMGIVAEKEKENGFK